MIEVTRKKNESFEALMRRFRNTLKMSGKLIQAKKKNFFERKPSKNKAKASKLMRLDRTSKIEYGIKTGKIKEEDLRKRRPGRR